MNPSENDILAKLVTQWRQAHQGQLAVALLKTVPAKRSETFTGGGHADSNA